MKTRIVSFRTLLVLGISTVAIFAASCSASRRLSDAVLYGWPEHFLAVEVELVSDGVPHRGPIHVRWRRLGLSLVAHTAFGLAVTALCLLVFGSIELIVRRRTTGSWNPEGRNRREGSPG